MATMPVARRPSAPPPVLYPCSAPTAPCASASCPPAAQRPVASSGHQQRRGSFKTGRWAPPEPPVGQDARDIAAAGIDAPTARALILGFTNFPEELPAHCEQLASLPIADRGTARM